MIYFIVILRQRASPDPNLSLNAFYGIMVSLFILLLDTLATMFTGIFVSFEKHFSSVGRNWKRISYFSIFVIFNSVAAILAYCLSQSLSDSVDGENRIVNWQNNSYIRSYDEWFQSCSVGPRSSSHIIAELNSRKIYDIKTTIGYWHKFTSQQIDGHIVPTFAYNRTQGLPLPSFNYHQVGCDSHFKYICTGDSPQRLVEVRALRLQLHADSCAFISNLSSFAGESLPKILFSAAINHSPWSDKVLFRLRSFAEEGSLYGFLFAFVFLKAIRIAFYYVYNDFISVVSNRLLLPVFKRLGYDPNVRSKKQSAISIKCLIICIHLKRAAFVYLTISQHSFVSFPTQLPTLFVMPRPEPYIFEIIH